MKHLTVNNNMLLDMKHMPVGLEVLAYHRDGKNFHQVKRVDETKVKMRWNKAYSQTVYDYHGWIKLPEIILTKQQVALKK